MNLINNIFVTVVLITFPILVYFFYSVYANVKNYKNNDIYLSLALLTSLYLCFKYGNLSSNNIILLFCNIPIVIAYVKKKGYIGIILSLITIYYSKNILTTETIPILIIKLLIYAILYFTMYKKSKINKLNFINKIAILQAFFVSFEYFTVNALNSISDLTNIFLVVLITYAITFTIIYILKTADDISKFYLSYQELEQDKQIKESLFKITHDIKNPIAVCKGYLDIFNINDISKTTKYINIIKNEIDRTLNILTDLSDLNKLKINKEIVDINMILEEMVESTEILFDNKNISITYGELDEVYVNGDYNKLKQLFLNILKNSYEAIDKEGRINIETSTNNDNYIIKITDSGKGMDQDTLKKIGEIFYTTKPHGTGIGVTLSKQIIKALDGDLTYKSKQGEYTTAIITIPYLKEYN